MDERRFIDPFRAATPHFGARSLLLTTVLIAGVIVGLGGPAPSFGRAVETTGIKGNSYRAPTYGWSIRWDPDLWWVEEEYRERGSEGIWLLTPGAGVYIVGYAAFRGDTLKCLRYEKAAMIEADGVSGVKSAKDLPMPTVGAGAKAMLKRYTFTYDSGESEARLHYVECRPLVEERAVLTIHFLALPETYESVLRRYEGLARTLRVADEAHDSDGDGADDGKTSDEKSARTGQYRGPSGAWSLTWDAEIWAAQESLWVLQGIVLTTDRPDGVQSVFSVVEDPAGEVELARCPMLSAMGTAMGYGFLDGVSSVSEVEEVGNLSLPRNAAEGNSGIYRFRVSYENGSTVQMVMFVECHALPLDGGHVIASAETAEKNYETALPLFEDVHAGLEISGEGASGDVLPDRGERPGWFDGDEVERPFGVGDTVIAAAEIPVVAD